MSKLLSKFKANSIHAQQVTPQSAGWEYVGFELIILRKGESFNFTSAQTEACLVVVSGKIDFKVSQKTSQNPLEFNNIGNRSNPFEKIPPYSLFVSNETKVSINLAQNVEYAEVAICRAPSYQQLPVRLITPEQVGVEHRGFGQNKRLVHNILPETELADSLLVVEVYTDEGNTSSWPSHKHDDKNSATETYLEETYYHRFNPKQGFALQRVYTDDRSLDECMPVYDQDVVMVPKGYHPVATIAGYDSYYLNVMAGPVRAWKFSWEQDHSWINSSEYANKSVDNNTTK